CDTYTYPHRRVMATAPAMSRRRSVRSMAGKTKAKIRTAGTITSTAGRTFVSRTRIQAAVAIHAHVIVRFDGRPAARSQVAMLSTESDVERLSLRITVFHIALRGSIASAAMNTSATATTTRDLRTVATTQPKNQNDAT